MRGNYNNKRPMNPGMGGGGMRGGNGGGMRGNFQQRGGFKQQNNNMRPPYNKFQQGKPMQMNGQVMQQNRNNMTNTKFKTVPCKYFSECKYLNSNI